MPLARPLFRPRPRAQARPTQIGFNPRSLFRPGNKGYFFDFYLAGSLFSDSARTTLAASGGPVGGVTDLSGNGNHAVQATSAARPTLTVANGRAFIQGDGIDDSLSIASLDMTGTDEVTVFAAVRKLSDAATAALLEHSASADTTAGTFSATAPSTAAANNLNFRTGGSVSITRAATGLTSPVSFTFVARSKIGTPVVSVSVNGVIGAGSAASQGTGNYTAQPHFLLSRAGTSRFFGGQVYALGVIGRQISDTETLQLMRWLNTRIGAY